MANIEQGLQTRKFDKRSKTHHGEPRRPEMVVEIIFLRDIKNLTWQVIGDRLGITRDGACKLYRRWHDWYDKN